MNKQTDKQTLATGADLTPALFEDFRQRLVHHCRGEGVRDHCTADAIFIVQAKRLVYGIDTGYTGNSVVIHGDRKHFSPQEYWDDLNEEERAELNEAAQEHSRVDFLELYEDDQWEVLGELEDHTVTGWDSRWEYVNVHFTREAAEAFIQRKAHDYPLGLRIYVDAQLYCWEWNTIKAAIMDGRLGLVDELPASWQEVESLREALEKTIASLDQLLPYLGKVPADIGLLNDALISGRSALAASGQKVEK